MSDRSTTGSNPRSTQIIAAARRARNARETSYRERALKLFPHVCGRCGREFEGKRLKELTVHHKDHNHDNNPPDGGNWELLCIYCHDEEHERLKTAEAYGPGASSDTDVASGGNRPFADLAELLKNKGS